MLLLLSAAAAAASHHHHHSFRLFHGPGVDSAPSENEYQEHFLGLKAAGA
jgi:hypothetical protein